VADPGTRHDVNVSQGLRLDELARRAGVASTTVRLYQNKGLLGRPRLVGRTGYYGDEHLQRLELIGRLQDRGFSLASIGELLATWDRGAGLDTVMGLEQQLGELLAEPRALVMEPAELLQRLPAEARVPELLQRAAQLRLVEAESDGHVRVPDPRFIDTGAALIGLGVPGDTVLDEWEHLIADTDHIVDRFIDVFEEHVLPRTASTELSATLRRLQDLAREVVGAALDRSITDRGRARLDQLAAARDADG